MLMCNDITWYKGFLILFPLPPSPPNDSSFLTTQFWLSLFRIIPMVWFMLRLVTWANTPRTSPQYRRKYPPSTPTLTSWGCRRLKKTRKTKKTPGTKPWSSRFSRHHHQQRYITKLRDWSVYEVKGHVMIVTQVKRSAGMAAFVY